MAPTSPRFKVEFEFLWTKGRYSAICRRTGHDPPVAQVRFFFVLKRAQKAWFGFLGATGSTRVNGVLSFSRSHKKWSCLVKKILKLLNIRLLLQMLKNLSFEKTQVTTRKCAATLWPARKISKISSQWFLLHFYFYCKKREGHVPKIWKEPCFTHSNSDNYLKVHYIWTNPNLLHTLKV